MQNPINLTDPTGMAPEGGETDPRQGTYLIVYGAGSDNPVFKTHNVADGFKINAEAQKEKLIKSGVPESSIVLVQALTENDFLTATNTEYDSGKIVQMDVYAHMSYNAINFGGDSNSENWDSTEGAKDYRLLNNGDTSKYNPDNDNEVLKINASNFEKNAKITLWGCLAGYDYIGIAQDFANHLNSNLVYEFNNFSRFKTTPKGKNIYDGTMIREKDKKNQKVNLTKFKPNN
ncbi:hypothetical protein FLJU110815_18040 [Flavobacterium jumunjinense]